MPYDYPKPQSGNTKEDLKQLWEALWMTVERLNVSEQMLEERLQKIEAQAGSGTQVIQSVQPTPETPGQWHLNFVDEEQEES